MDIHQIETDLNHADFDYRLKAISALKDYDPEVAVPLLISKLHDPEFLVRSFVARELGKQRTAESFAALLEIVKFDNTPNVRAEAANSLSLFGSVSISHLVQAFYQDDHWLLRRSILAAFTEMDCPRELFDVCIQALAGEDLAVQEAAIDAIATLSGSSQHQLALSQLLELVNSESSRIRTRVAYALNYFKDPQAQTALAQLRQDSDRQVVSAALENLLSH